jgi:hypothetical protein
MAEINFRVSETHHTALKRLATDQGISIARIIKAQIEKEVASWQRETDEPLTKAVNFDLSDELILGIKSVHAGGLTPFMRKMVFDLCKESVEVE